jgi:hypothetical protein
LQTHSKNVTNNCSRKGFHFIEHRLLRKIITLTIYNLKLSRAS